MRTRFKQHGSTYRRHQPHEESCSDELAKQNDENKGKRNKNQIIVIPFDWGAKEAALVVASVCLGFITRTWLLNQPRAPALSEKYHIQAIGDYSRHWYFVPRNPPFPELFASFVSANSMYDDEYTDKLSAEGFTFDTMHYVSLRQVSAFASALTVPFIYIASRSYGFSNIASFTCAFLVSFESSFVTSGRLSSSDGFVQLFAVLTIMFLSFLHHFAQYSIPWVCICLMQVVSTALAFSSSYSSFSLLIFVLLYYMLFFKCPYSIATNVASSLGFFYLVFYIHTFFTSEGSDSELINAHLSRSLSMCLQRKSKCKYIQNTIETIANSIKQSIMNTSRKLSFKKTVASINRRKLVVMFNKVNGVWALLGVVVSIPRILFHMQPLGYTAILQYGCDLSLFFSILFGGEDPTMLTIPYIFAIMIGADSFDKELSPRTASFFFTTINILSAAYFFWNYAIVFGYEK